MKNLIILLILGIASCSLANGCPKEDCLLEKTTAEAAWSNAIESGSDEWQKKWTEVCELEPCSEFCDIINNLEKPCPVSFFKYMIARWIETEEYKNCLERMKNYLWPWDLFFSEKREKMFADLKDCHKEMEEHQTNKNAKACMHEMAKLAHGMKEPMHAFPDMMQEMVGGMSDECKGSIEKSFEETIKVFTTYSFDPEEWDACVVKSTETFFDVFGKFRSIWTCNE